MLYGREINMRCGRYGDANQLVWPARRYVDGLKALKPSHPERIVFAAIVGIPLGLPANLTLDELLARPEMQFQGDPATQNSLPLPSCTRPSSDATRPERMDKAYPARRFVEVAKGFGENAVLHSICADSYAPALRTVVDRIATMM